MHLLLAVSALELPGGFTLSKVSPSLRLSEPLPALGRVRCCAFSTQKLHSAAVRNVAHGVSFLVTLEDGRDSACQSKTHRRLSTAASKTKTEAAECLCDQGESLWNSRLRGVAFFEARSDLVERPVVPSLGFGEQLPAILGMKRGALTAQGFHRAAVNEVLHRHLPDSVGDILSPVLSRCHYDYATGRLPYRPRLDNLQ
jgi:hypothetical protein